MKTVNILSTVKTLALASALLAPAFSYAQSGTSTKSTQESHYQRKTKKHTVKTADSSDLNAILKDSANAESGPILNDNGNVNSTGSIDGSRSSTGRPDADTTTTYTVKRKKKTITPTNISDKPKP